MSVVNDELLSLASIADWGIEPSAKLAVNIPSTVKFPVTEASLFTDKSNTVILLFVPRINKFPPKERSFTINNLLFIVTSSSTNNLCVVVTSVVKSLFNASASPVTADWGIESSR